MTLEQVKAMTDEELRRRVAELLGWTNICEESHYSYDDMEHLDVLCGISKTGCKDEMPNYPQDLNACHEMEKEIRKDHEYTGWYLDALKNILDSYNYQHSCKVYTIFATARQRCEAFIAVKEKEK